MGDCLLANLELQARAWCVVDAKTCAIVAERDSTHPLRVASITKLVTALVVLKETEGTFKPCQRSLRCSCCCFLHRVAPHRHKPSCHHHPAYCRAGSISC